MSEEENAKRPSWDDLFISVVNNAVRRSTCIYHPTGAVFVDADHHIVGFGYSGPTKGDFHCSDAGYCLKVDGDPITGEIKRCNGAHAEMNAIANCGNTDKLRGSTLYCTIYPCYDCMKILNNVGVKRIVFVTEYRRVVDGGKGSKEEREQEAVDLAAKRGIIIEKYSDLDQQKVRMGKTIKGTTNTKRMIEENILDQSERSFHLQKEKISAKKKNKSVK